MSKVTLYLSDQPAPAPWGKNASLSYNADSITIHFKSAQKCEDIQKAARKLEGQNFYDLKLTGEHWDQESVLAFWLGFRAQKSYAKAKISWPKLSKQEKALFDKKVEIIDWVRETINLPSDVITPEVLANKAIDLLRKQSEHISVKLISGEQLKEQQMMGIYSVGKGSENPAVFAEIDFNPTKDEKAPVTASLVGKGITFDSGGYSLKPSSFMLTMRSDMGGAALLTGSLALAIANGLNKRVKLYLCCAENMVSGQAFKLGDIIHYRNGVSVEIGNTDAEGRLVLADGLISASNDNPKYIIDCATLTGAAKVAVGNDYHSVYSFDDAFTNQLFNSATVEKERFWRLPLADFHRSQIPSSFADIDNSGSANTAGGSTAAAFLSYFVKNYQQNWIHIDCSATFQKSATGLWATGATGIGVKTLAHLLNQLK